MAAGTMTSAEPTLAAERAPMPKPLGMRQLLREFGLRPKKSLGQNWLVDESALSRIAVAAELTRQDIVLEIGPGLGALTRHLAERAGRVIAVELDATLIPPLSRSLADYANVTIVQGDILQFSPSALVGGPDLSSSPIPYKVVANLPYYITSAVIRHLLEADIPPSLIVLAVQLEVAQRITAVPGKLSLLAVSVQFYGRPSIVTHIKAGSFYPAPQVDSAVVRIEPYNRPAVDVADREGFFAVVKAGFSQKRKQLHNALAAGLARSQADVASALESAGVDGRRRAETLTLDEWASVARAILSFSPTAK
jgi:16S rRNA (adenine1518-N6/adenine1519-N6)-dimethyltransferase